MKNWIKTLNEMKACGDALEWCKGYESLDKAWELVLARLDEKTGWGRTELKQLMLECLVEAGKEGK